MPHLFLNRCNSSAVFKRYGKTFFRQNWIVWIVCWIFENKVDKICFFMFCILSFFIVRKMLLIETLMSVGQREGLLLHPYYKEKLWQKLSEFSKKVFISFCVYSDVFLSVIYCIIIPAFVNKKLRTQRRFRRIHAECGKNYSRSMYPRLFMMKVNKIKYTILLFARNVNRADDVFVAVVDIEKLRTS